MEGLIHDAPYLAAILGTTLGFVTFGLGMLRDLSSKREFYCFVKTKTDEALVSADRVLKNGSTPAEIRMLLLYLLEALAQQEVGRAFTEHYASLQAPKTRRPGSKGSLAEAMDKLHARNPELAADAHKALMGLILVVPLINADKVKVSEIRGLRYVGEGATDPGAVFGRASRALAMDNGGTDVGGGFAAA